jgi:hypothetical protein
MIRKILFKKYFLWKLHSHLWLIFFLANYATFWKIVPIKQKWVQCVKVGTKMNFED